MKKINWKMLVITCIVSILPIFIGLYFYSKLPESIAIHFDINNNPDNYFPKAVFVFGMPIMMVLLQTFACIINDLSDKYKEANKKATTVFKWIIPILSITMYVMTVSYSLGNSIDIRKVVMIILGIIFIVMGNYLPKTKGNSITKIHIKNENVLNKVNRFSGYMLILNGILFIVSTLFEPIVSVVILVLMILESLGLYCYAYVKNRD